jgi:hypothetical protein
MPVQPALPGKHFRCASDPGETVLEWSHCNRRSGKCPTEMLVPANRAEHGPVETNDNKGEAQGHHYSRDDSPPDALLRWILIGILRTNCMSSTPSKGREW